jgi:phosphopantothenoylcysteine decarboxylase / phosphopantothenate---cysteine ligase
VKKPLVLVTAGPTREKVDPVRFISNYSTGAFGYEIAGEALRRGCRVVLVSGPTLLKPPPGAKFIRIESALDMLRAVKKESVGADYVFMAAAVSDWRPKSYSEKKIKRRDGNGKRSIELVDNPDILKGLGRNKRYVLVGFALETESLEANAVRKLKNKNLDIIVANHLRNGSGPFGNGRTDISIIDRTGVRKAYKRRTKRELAKIILDKAFGFKIK